MLKQSSDEQVLTLPSFRRRLRQLLGEEEAQNDRAGRCVAIVISTLIVVNVLAVMCSTLPGAGVQYGRYLYAIEVVSVVIFTLEFMMRLWAIGRFRTLFTPLMLIDLLAILPFYLPMLIPFDLRIIRIMRLVRIFRILKMARYSNAMQVLGRVMKAKLPELVAVGAMLLIVLIVISSFVFFAEHAVQPDKFSSIPDTLWWGVVTMTTIGYGDVFPVTPIGKALAALLAILGIGLFALPAGIIGSGFIEELQRGKVKREIICPHCGKPIKQEDE